MEEIFQTALAYYENLSSQQKQMVSDFYKSMDTDGDERISFSEYKNFLEKRGFDASIVTISNFFEGLDRDGNGSLDFNEFLAVYYLYATKRMIFCGKCGVFLAGLYFTCCRCFWGRDTSSGNSYDLCCACYRARNIVDHDHQDAIFVDNYTLLRMKWPQESSQPTSDSTDQQGRFRRGMRKVFGTIVAAVNTVDDFVKTIDDVNDIVEESCNQM